MNRKAVSMLSLCARAGKILSGSETVEQAIQKGEAILVIIAGDASDNTKKKFTNKATFYETDYIIVSEKEELSHSTGKYNQAVFAVTDKGFADKIKEYLSD